MSQRLDRVTNDVLGVLGVSPAKSESLLWFGSGTAALTAVVRAAARGRPRRTARVLMPATVCPSVYMAVAAAGSLPVFVASNPFDGSYGLDLQALQEFPADGATCLIWVHQYGCVGNVEPLRELCRRKEWLLIEDAALTFGVRHQGQMTGTLGDCAILSFGRGKIVDIEYGGAVCLNEGPAMDRLGPLIADEHARQPRGHGGGRAPADIAIERFDGEMKRAYNYNYDAFRSGAVLTELRPWLARCASVARPLDDERLDELLTTDLVRSAAARVAGRNARASWWSAWLARSARRDVRAIQHSAGTYWRLNVSVPSSVRHSILRSALDASLPMSSWYPPLYWFADGAGVVGDTRREAEFADTTLNLWVDGIDDWDGYASAITALLSGTPAQAASVS